MATGDPAAGDTYHPDTALVNYYDTSARMGMHQDKDEIARDPVVSLSMCGDDPDPHPHPAVVQHRPGRGEQQ